MICFGAGKKLPAPKSLTYGHRTITILEIPTKSEVRTMQALTMSMMMPQLPSRFAA